MTPADSPATARNVSIVVAPHALLAGAIWMPPGPLASAAAALWIVAQAIVTTQLLRPRSRMFGPNLWRAGAQRLAALTFDDGPHPEDTPAILDILAARRTRATFFFIGARARRHPELVRRVAREGHGVGVHSDTHPWWFSLAGASRLRREVRDAAATLEDLSGRRPRYFRPPMGHKNIFLADAVAAEGLRLVTWTRRPYDTLGRSPEKIHDAIVLRAAPGDILLLHEGVRRKPGRASPTVTALGGIIAGLLARGLAPVSLEELEGDPASPPASSPESARRGPAAGGG